jgi:hypothetical protein
MGVDLILSTTSHRDLAFHHPAGPGAAEAALSIMITVANY